MHGFILKRNYSLHNSKFQMWFGTSRGMERVTITSSNNRHTLRGHSFADLPSFVQPIGNVTAAIGKEAILPCTIRKLGNHKVRDLKVARKKEEKNKEGSSWNVN